MKAMMGLIIWNAALSFLLVNLAIAGLIANEIAACIACTSWVAAELGYAEGVQGSHGEKDG